MLVYWIELVQMKKMLHKARARHTFILSVAECIKTLHHWHAVNLRDIKDLIGKVWPLMPIEKYILYILFLAFSKCLLKIRLIFTVSSVLFFINTLLSHAPLNTMNVKWDKQKWDHMKNKYKYIQNTCNTITLHI